MVDDLLTKIIIILPIITYYRLIFIIYFIRDECISENILKLNLEIHRDERRLVEGPNILSVELCNTSIQGELVQKDSNGQWYIDNKTKVKIITEDGIVIKRLEIGSIQLELYCPTLEALEKLVEKCSSGLLKNHFNKVLKVEEYKAKYGVPDLFVDVTLDEATVASCRKDIEDQGEF